MRYESEYYGSKYQRDVKKAMLRFRKMSYERLKNLKRKLEEDLEKLEDELNVIMSKYQELEPRRKKILELAKERLLIEYGEDRKFEELGFFKRLFTEKSISPEAKKKMDDLTNAIQKVGYVSEYTQHEIRIQIEIKNREITNCKYLKEMADQAFI